MEYAAGVLQWQEAVNDRQYNRTNEQQNYVLDERKGYIELSWTHRGSDLHIQPCLNITGLSDIIGMGASRKMLFREPEYVTLDLEVTYNSRGTKSGLKRNLCLYQHLISILLLHRRARKIDPRLRELNLDTPCYWEQICVDYEKKIAYPRNWW